MELTAEQIEVANCRTTDPDAFFPEMEHAQAVAQVLNICAMCHISTECLSYAISANEQYGIWAGASTRDRQRMRRNPHLRIVHLARLEKTAEAIREREATNG